MLRVVVQAIVLGQEHQELCGILVGAFCRNGEVRPADEAHAACGTLREWQRDYAVRPDAGIREPTLRTVDARLHHDFCGAHDESEFAVVELLGDLRGVRLQGFGRDEGVDDERDVLGNPFQSLRRKDVRTPLALAVLLDE